SGQPHSRTLSRNPKSPSRRQVLECGCPLPLLLCRRAATDTFNRARSGGLIGLIAFIELRLFPLAPTLLLGERKQPPPPCRRWKPGARRRRRRVTCESRSARLLRLPSRGALNMALCRRSDCTENGVWSWTKVRR